MRFGFEFGRICRCNTDVQPS